LNSKYTNLLKVFEEVEQIHLWCLNVKLQSYTMKLLKALQSLREKWSLQVL